MKEEINFEKAFAELEKITLDFERGDVDLETSLKKFQKGLELAEICRKKLKEVENKIIKIKKDFENIHEKKSDEDIELEL